MRRHVPPWSIGAVSVAQAVALVLPLVAAVAVGGVAVWGLLATALMAALFWEVLFSVLRSRTLTVHGITTAMIVAVTAAPSVPLWQVAFAVSFGASLCELVFGGRGFGVVNAGAAALAFLSFSFPGTALVGGSFEVASASVTAGAVLVALGLIAWPILVAGLVSTVLTLLLASADIAGVQLITALAFGFVFLVADPVTSAVTPTGRWVHGGLAGVLAGLFGAAAGGSVSPASVVFAALLASLFAPLVDDMAVRFHLARRARRHG